MVYPVVVMTTLKCKQREPTDQWVVNGVDEVGRNVYYFLWTFTAFVVGGNGFLLFRH